MLRKCVAEPHLILQNQQEYYYTPCLLNNHMGSFFCKYFFSCSWYNIWKKDAWPFLLQYHVDYRYSYDSISLQSNSFCETFKTALCFYLLADPLVSLTIWTEVMAIYIFIYFSSSLFTNTSYVNNFIHYLTRYTSHG